MYIQTIVLNATIYDCSCIERYFIKVHKRKRRRWLLYLRVRAIVVLNAPFT